jgi:hypothetical protein
MAAARARIRTAALARGGGELEGHFDMAVDWEARIAQVKAAQAAQAAAAAAAAEAGEEAAEEDGSHEDELEVLQKPPDGMVVGNASC